MTLPIEVIFESPSVKALAAGLEATAGRVGSEPDGRGLDGSMDALWQEETGNVNRVYGQAMEAREIG